VTASALKRLVRRQGGVTLIELVVVMPMLTILLGGLTFALVRTMHWNDQVTEQTVQQSDARAALSTLVSDLRQAYKGDGVPVSTFAPTGSGGATQITFYSPDRTTPYHLRMISYQLVNGSLQRQVTTSSNTDGPPWTFPATGPWTTVLTKVVNSDVFTFYDASDPAVQVTDTADVSLIESVVVKLRVSTGGQQPRITTFTDTASIRRTT
jgi:type II secretory pathway pseudopilin PulG